MGMSGKLLWFADQFPLICAGLSPLKSDRTVLTTLSGVYAFAVLSVVVGENASWIVALFKSGVNQEWLGFLGAVLGSLMTIAAGVIAWLAAQRTIAANEALAARRERDTLAVVQKELTPKLEQFVLYWRVIEKASHGNSDVCRTGVDLIKSLAGDGISDEWLDEMRKLGSDLSPVKRYQFVDVLRGFQLVRRQLLQDASTGMFGDSLWLKSLRTMLSHLDKYLKSFDCDLAKRFDQFLKSPIDHREIAEHLEPLVSQFEKTGKIQ